ncbi:hypothetical protein COCNU_06G013810 [Cocos nucifera]|uniref:Uncharacterized protein n=1 Tax=Cocos nucifera TaxID=13894 RepID=A0A8K0ICZ5_COCNU|nr:hypothetical protein COCNU_06G013810 [Cocos nucifera]
MSTFSVEEVALIVGLSCHDMKISVVGKPKKKRRLFDIFGKHLQLQYKGLESLISQLKSSKRKKDIEDTNLAVEVLLEITNYLRSWEPRKEKRVDKERRQPTLLSYLAALVVWFLEHTNIRAPSDPSKFSRLLRWRVCRKMSHDKNFDNIQFHEVEDTLRSVPQEHWFLSSVEERKKSTYSIDEAKLKEKGIKKKMWEVDEEEKWKEEEDDEEYDDEEEQEEEKKSFIKRKEKEAEEKKRKKKEEERKKMKEDKKEDEEERKLMEENMKEEEKKKSEVEKKKKEEERRRKEEEKKEDEEKGRRRRRRKRRRRRRSRRGGRKKKRGGGEKEEAKRKKKEGRA